MKFGREIAHIVLATWLVLPLAVPSALSSGADPETVGQLDVMDLQRLMSLLLHPSPVAGTHSDLNSDGRIDVLDFQCLVAQRPTDGQPELPGRSDADGILVHSLYGPVQGFLDTRHLVCLPPDAGTSVCMPGGTIPTCDTVRTARYIRGAAPNSPPAAF